MGNTDHSLFRDIDKHHHVNDLYTIGQKRQSITTTLGSDKCKENNSVTSAKIDGVSQFYFKGYCSQSCIYQKNVSEIFK